MANMGFRRPEPLKKKSQAHARVGANNGETYRGMGGLHYKKHSAITVRQGASCGAPGAPGGRPRAGARPLGYATPIK